MNLSELIKSLTYKHTLISTLGVIGSATPSGWDADTDMTYNEEDGSWNLTTNLTDGEIKIRANNDWDINWGGSIAEPTSCILPVPIPTKGGLRLAEFP